VQVRFDVARNAGELLVGAYAAFGAFALLHDLLSFFLILPKVRLGAAFFEFG
jgi:hypothetical protein